MAGFFEKYVNPRFKYLVPATIVMGLLSFSLCYKMYYSRPAQKKIMLKNEQIAEELWQLTHPEENSQSSDSRFQQQL